MYFKNGNKNVFSRENKNVNGFYGPQKQPERMKITLIINGYILAISLNVQISCESVRISANIFDIISRVK